MNNLTLRVKQLTKYYGKFRAINNLNLSVKTGTCHGFLGPNGAGKTTTIRTILNILEPTSGKIELFGESLNKGKIILHERIGYIPGDVSLYSHMSVKQLLDYFSLLRPNRPSNRMKEFVERFQLDITKHNKGLSKGNRQKVALVQAFMHDPDLYIFDEPSSGLDPLMQQVLYQVIEEEKARRKTFLISSHNLTEIQRIADIVSVIREGEIVETIDVSSLANRAIKKLSVEFSSSINYDTLKFPGVELIKNNGKRITLLISKSLNEVLATISQLPISSITIPEPSLEDYFMHFYREKDTRGISK